MIEGDLFLELDCVTSSIRPKGKISQFVMYNLKDDYDSTLIASSEDSVPRPARYSCTPL